MDESTGRRVCELVMGIIATDQELHPTELKFMLKTFKTFGVATGDEDEALSPTTRAFEAAKAMSLLPEDVREEAIELLLDSAAVDGKVVKAERTFLHAVAKAAGIEQDVIDSRIEAKLAAVKLG
jgi:uncharacterized tellurite resistance protein B-like protein